MDLDMAMVETLLRGQFPAVTRDHEGDLEVTLESGRDYEVTMWVTQAGRTGGVLSCIAESTKHRVQRSRWAEAIWVCNQWNQAHFFPRVSLLIPDFASSAFAPAQCRTILELARGDWDMLFLDAQLGMAGGYSTGFYEWIDENPDLARLFGEFDEAREREHIRRLAAAGQTAGIVPFAEEFLIDEGFPRVREPEGFWW